MSDRLTIEILRELQGRMFYWNRDHAPEITANLLSVIKRDVDAAIVKLENASE